MYEHIKEDLELINETRDMLQVIACSKVKKTFLSRGGKLVNSYHILTEHKDAERLKKNLEYLYFNKGIGFKLLSKAFGNVSYTRLRTIFRYLKIEKRSGKSCVTQSLRKARKENALSESNPWRDWTNKDWSKNANRSKRYLGGWYFNKSMQKLVWLRSSWEYGYAEWLDKKGYEWDVEVKSYLLSDGRYYRPDFFIYHNGKLQKIVEIKSMWNNGAKNRVDKFVKFKSEYPNVKAELITKDLFTLIQKKYSTVLKEWKENRIMENQDDCY